nr:PD40 domain-containing protein [Anaerolineae bacterium]
MLVCVTALVMWAGNQSRNTVIPAIYTTIYTEGGSRPANDGILNSAPENNPPVATTGNFGVFVLAMYAGDQLDLFAIPRQADSPIRLTSHRADDKEPAFSPDGQRIAFASRRDGNWELYVLSLLSGELSQLTYNLAYEGNPEWSPDGQWLVYEAYYNGNLDICIIKADGTDGPYVLTTNEGMDASPTWWANAGRGDIIYVSQRGRSQDIYALPLDDPDDMRALNLTNTPELAERDPLASPSGDILFYARMDGEPVIFVAEREGDSWAAPHPLARGATAVWTNTDQIAILAPHATGTMLELLSGSRYELPSRIVNLPALAQHLDWMDEPFPDPLPQPLALNANTPIEDAFTEYVIADDSTSPPYKLVNLSQLGVTADLPYLSERVDDSFSALRRTVEAGAGWDFLGVLDSMLWNLDYQVSPGQSSSNWHMAGRAFDIMQNYALLEPPLIELAPVLDGPVLRWHLYVRCAVQDGSLGEPLHVLPWDFSARASGDPLAYDQGGQYRDDIPVGYYINFTELASLYGWEPSPADHTWRHNWYGTLFWQYEKRDGLNWQSAMLELYTSDELTGLFSTVSDQ